MDSFTLECLKEREQAAPQWLPPAGLGLWTARRCVRGEERVSQWMRPAGGGEGGDFGPQAPGGLKVMKLMIR